MVVLSFVLNVLLVGDSATNSEQHRRLTENKLNPGENAFLTSPYISKSIKKIKKKYKQNPRNPERFSKRIIIFPSLD